MFKIHLGALIMKAEKNDLRSLYSKSVIKRTLVQLLETKPIQKISVAELCKECKINRGTFYNHFFDIYDVYRSIEADFFGEIQKRLDSRSVFNLDAEFFSTLMHFFYESPVMSKISAMSIRDAELVNRIRDMIRAKVFKDIDEAKIHYDTEKMDGLFGYVVGGCSYLIFRWAWTSKEKDIPKVAKQCAEYTAQLLKPILSQIGKDSEQSR